MKKLISGLFISLDGVAEAPADWHFPYFNDEMGAAVDAIWSRSDTMLLGRKSWQEFAGFWPQNPDAEGADVMNGTRKLVVSSTLDNVDAWLNSTLLEGDPIEAVRKAKAGEGKAISMSGSLTLTRSLLQAKLVDELHLLIHPIALGSGARLFDGGEHVPLALLSSTTFSTGVLHAVYGPA
ncbi:dihydrofolate reductase [Kribbella turkmenica]|uniref:Dihydrofolate reductase n=1 Tax=Kribbella turkmenica TaxID=2530375 RepID=A0A4R4XA87_9ACTN|nr:dihydrofolate reductase family protein [Kribbella turkmenica]TDD27481.1 dihydrofolate reductase [Kribbella turkmenica]